MTEFHVRDIFRISGRPEPILVGVLDGDGDLRVRDRLELRKADGTTYGGWLRTIEFHSRPGEIPLVIAGDIATYVEIGDTISLVSPAAEE